MSKNLQFYVFLFLSMILLSCSRQPQELKTAEQLIENAPDSALHILQRISPEKYKSDGNRALYGLLMIRTLDKKLLPLKPDTLLDFSIDWYQKHPDPDRLASCYLYKGRTYKYAFQYEKAMNFYLKALDEAKDSKDNLLLGRINFDLGDIYNIQNDFSLAREKYYSAYIYFKKNKFQSLTFYSLLNIGRTYFEAKDYNRSETYYRKINSLATDSIQKGDLYQEMGLNFYFSKKIDSALVYFRKIIDYPYAQNNRALRYYYLADLYFDLKQIDSAYYYAINSLKYKSEIRTEKGCYRILVNVEGLKGNLNAVTKFMSLYQDCNDSIRKIDSQTKGSYIETVHNSTKEVVKSRYKISYLYILLTIIVILFAIIFILVRKKNLIEKYKIQQIHLQQKADMHKEVLVNHREVLQNKIQERKVKLAPERKKTDHAGQIVIDRSIYEELLHINDTEYFYDEMNSVLNNLVKKLQSQYPSITSREIMWCCLSLLRIPNTDMYLLLKTNVDSLKKMKQRLVPKFKLSRVSELEDFLIGLISE